MNEQIIIEKIQTKAEMDVCLDLILDSFDSKYLIFSKYMAIGAKEIFGLEIQNPFSAYYFLSAKCNDMVVGFAELREDFPIANLNLLAIDTKQKGKNIGNYFMQDIIDSKRNGGFKILQLHVFKSNMLSRKWMANYPYVYTDERNVCRLLPNQKGNEPSFKIVNYHQIITDREKFGFVYLRVLYQKKIIDIVCVNDILFLPSGDSDLLNIGLSLMKTFKLKDLYFYCEKDKQVLLNYEVIDEIYSLVMTL